MWNLNMLCLWTVVLLIAAVSPASVLSESDLATQASAVVNYNTSDADADVDVADDVSNEPLAFASPMKNFTKVSGESLKLKCEVRGRPPVTDFRWFKDEAPLVEEKGRIRIRSKTGTGEIQVSRVVFQSVNPMDTGFYRCEASNGLSVTSSESMVKVHRSGSGPGRKKPDPKPDVDDDDEHDGSDHFGKLERKTHFTE